MAKTNSENMSKEQREQDWERDYIGVRHLTAEEQINQETLGGQILGAALAFDETEASNVIKDLIQNHKPVYCNNLSRTQLVILFDNSPLIVLNCRDRVKDTNRILKWYSEKYAIDYDRITCCWVDVIHCADDLKKDLGL